MNCKLSFFFRVNLKALKNQGGPTSPYEFCEKHLHGDEVVANVCTEEDDFDPEVWIFNYPLSNENIKEIEEPKQTSYNFNSIDVPSLINDFKNEPHVVLFLNAFSDNYGKENIQVCFGALVYDQHRFE